MMASRSEQRTSTHTTGFPGRWLYAASEKLRVNPRKASYRNLERVSINGDWEVTFRLKRPQPAFLMLLADGFSPIYPCHVPARDMAHLEAALERIRTSADIERSESIVVLSNLIDRSRAEG